MIRPTAKLAANRGGEAIRRGLKIGPRLDSLLQSHWHESQIYRIDHYLGKEAVQNILVFRFANEFVEPLLNSNIDHIQLTVGNSRRGVAWDYNKAGALRDMVQNHLLQVTSLVCMEPPSSFTPGDPRRKIKTAPKHQADRALGGQ